MIKIKLENFPWHIYIADGDETEGCWDSTGYPCQFLEGEWCQCLLWGKYPIDDGLPMECKKIRNTSNLTQTR